MWKRFASLTAILAVMGTSLATPTVALASSSEDILEVCSTARTPFVNTRREYNERIRNGVIQGIAIGALAGLGVGGAVTGGSSDSTRRDAMIAGSLLGALAGGVTQYLEVNSRSPVKTARMWLP
jgi:uncharacterized protein YcfJ